jgi:hypothetical protein
VAKRSQDDEHFSESKALAIPHPLFEGANAKPC